MDRRYKVLAAISSREVFDALRPLLSRSSVECNQIANGEACLLLASTLPYDLVLVQLPLIDMSAPALLTALRDSSSPCQKARILFLASGGQSAAAAAFHRAGTENVSLSTSTEEFRRLVADALGIAVRSSNRLLINVHVQTEETGITHVYQSENLSRTGMLLQTGHPLPVGTEFLFDFTLLQGTSDFQGTGRVVRHTDPSREKIYGMGITFTGFEQGSREQLDQFVRRELAA